MATYTAAIGTAGYVVTGDHCDVSVYEEDTEGGYPAGDALFTAETAIRTDHEDALGVVEEDAERVLSENGWQVTGKWSVTDNALYAPVERA